MDAAGLERLSSFGHGAATHALAYALSVMAVLTRHAAAQTALVAVFEDDLMPASLSHEVSRASDARMRARALGCVSGILCQFLPCLRLSGATKASALV